MYKDKNVILAPKHQKQEAIQSPFEVQLGCSIHVPTQYDTDQFSTFAGEIPRNLSPYETLIQKAREAAIQFEYRYAIFSEGSFGPHPYIDLDNDLIVTEIEISTETNYDHTMLIL